MKYSVIRTVGALLVASAVTLSCSITHAGWGLLGGSSGGGSTGGSSGYAAAYGSSGGSSGYAAYTAAYGSSGGSTGAGSSGHPGIVQRIGNRLHTAIANKHARHAARRAAYGSSGGYSSYGSSGGGYAAAYGSSGYSYGSHGAGYGSSGVSYGSHGAGYGSTGVSYGSTGVGYGSTGSSYGGVYYGASKSDVSTTSTAASLVSNTTAEDDSVLLTVTVPSNAKVFVNGNATTSSGSVRQFVSHGLKPGKAYKFEVRAEVTDSKGEVLTEEKTVSVTAGQREQMQFAFVDSNSTLDTSVTLHLPEDAKVILAGKPTKATGSERTFRTQHLKPGQVWDAYEVEVRLGDQVKRQTVRLIAGDNLQLSFNFDEDETAGRIAAR